MAKSAVKSNYKQFNKNQEKLIERFNIGLNSGLAELMNVTFSLAKETGLETINFRGMEKRNTPIWIRKKLIKNPILPTRLYKEVANKKDTSKMLDRTGEMREALEFISKNKVGRRARNAQIKKTSNTKFKQIIAEISGYPASALRFASGGRAAGVIRARRRFMEKSFAKTKAIFKRMMLNKRLISRGF